MYFERNVFIKHVLGRCSRVVHIYLNISYTNMVKYSTGYEDWFYRKPNVSHFKIFGSTCFVYIPGQQRKTLDGKYVRCVFIGYL